MLEGWLCPRCKRVNSPWTEKCSCVDNEQVNNMCVHQWCPESVSTAGTTYRCYKCGATKTECYNTDSYINNITNY